MTRRRWRPTRFWRRSPGLLMSGWLIAGLGCAEESHEAAADREAVDLLGQARAAAYVDWAEMPGFDPTAPSTSPHGQTSSVYLNRVLAEAIADGPPWPVGSVVVKDSWADGEVLVRALMRKDEAGWFYALFDADDRIVAAGVPSHCLDCHDDGRDQLLSAPMATSEP